LGISRPSIYALLETHGLTAGRKRADAAAQPDEPATPE
jgi:hypothetical protein